MNLFRFKVQPMILLILLIGLAAGPDRAAQAVPAACAGDVAALRAELAAANAPGSPVTTIALSSGCTYALLDAPYPGIGLNALPVLTTETPITLNGNGATLDLSGSSVGARFFEVGSGANLTINNLTLLNGGTKADSKLYEGGAARVDRSETLDPITHIITYRIGSLTLNHVTLSGSGAGQGGALYNEGYLTLNDCEVLASTSAGGAIYSQNGSLMISHSSIHNNSFVPFTIGGAGVMVNGPSLAVVRDSSLSNNLSSGPGGALNILASAFVLVSGSYFEGNNADFGGAVYVSLGGGLVVANSTFYNNLGSQGAALYTAPGAAASLLNSTLVNNRSSQAGGGSIYAGTTILVKNTLVGINSNGLDCAGAALDVGSTHNLDTAGGCGSSFAQHTPAELALGVAGFSSGPTQVIPLLAGSAAIDAGDPATCAAVPVSNRDQAGRLRPLSGTPGGAPVCDIGAFEYLPTAGYLPMVSR